MATRHGSHGTGTTGTGNTGTTGTSGAPGSHTTAPQPPSTAKVKGPMAGPSLDTTPYLRNGKHDSTNNQFSLEPAKEPQYARQKGVMLREPVLLRREAEYWGRSPSQSHCTQLS